MALNNLSLPPTSQSANATGGVDYHWSLEGVTADQRNLEFDLTLKDMAPNEQRAVADAAYIEFDNSFSAEKLRVDLPIPVVEAASGLALTLATDKDSYGANEAVLVRPQVTNVGPTDSAGQVEITLYTASGEAVATLPNLDVPSLSAGASLTLESPWNTGTILVGDYQASARLLDNQGRLLDEATAPFSIVTNQAAIIDGSVTTDKPVYAAWDTVLITGRIENVTANAIQAPTRVEMTVASPAGQVLLDQSASLGELLPGALRDLNFTLNLVDAASGDYPVTITKRGRDPFCMLRF